MSESTEDPSFPIWAPQVNFADVALIDAKKCAAIGDMSVSWWHAEVAAGRAPPPTIRKPRCTRWNAAVVHSYWKRFAEQDADSSMIQQAAKASRAAQAKRKLASAGGVE